MFDIILSVDGEEYPLKQSDVPLRMGETERLSGKGVISYWREKKVWKCNKYGVFLNVRQKIDNKYGVPMINDYDVPSLVRMIKRREKAERKLKRKQYIVSLRKSIGGFLSLK